jgi:hypothetical protein
VGQITVLGVDLAVKSWQDNGSALLSIEHDSSSHWTSCVVGAIEWPTQDLSASAMATAIDRAALTQQAAAVSLDGPQGRRDPEAGARKGVGRACEYEARTPGKTGMFGQVYPGGYFRWVQFSIEVFDRLLTLPHVHLVNDTTVQTLSPLPTGNYYLLECFPTSTWRTSNLVPLPGHRKAPPAIVTQYARSLQAAFGLPEASITNHHDHLQAIVAALPAAGLLGGPCKAIARGIEARAILSQGEIPAHRVEGLIWDALPGEIEK